MSGRPRRRSAATADATAAPLAAGTVLASHRRHFAVALDDGGLAHCVLKGRSLALACGDRVLVSPQVGGAAIESILPRTTLLHRSDAFREKLLAANVTQIIGVVAPDLSIDEELLSRWIVAGAAQRCRVLIVANKADQPGFDTLLARLRPYHRLCHVVVPLAAKNDVAPLRPWVDGERSVLIGQSGMGKSTILNGLVPTAAARTAEVSRALGAGRHTTTHSTLYPLPPPLSGWIVDSPGMKAFGLAHLQADEIVAAFPEFASLGGECRFRNCGHRVEPGCALRAAVERGEAAPHRLALLLTLLAESTGR